MLRAHEGAGDGQNNQRDQDAHPNAGFLDGAALLRLRLALDVHDDGGYVVVAAGIARGGHQHVGAGLRIGDVAQDFLDLIIVEHGVKAVGAQKQSVARAEVEFIDVGLHVRVGADGTRDHRTVGVESRLGLGDLARFDKVGHQAMIARELLDAPVVQKIGTRVAHLGDHHALARHLGGRHGGAHAFAANALTRGFDDVEVGRFHGADHALRVLDGIGQVLHRADGHLGSNLARLMAAHAVAHDEQGRSNKKAILVVLADQAHVGARAEAAMGNRVLGRGDVCGDVHYSNLTRMVTSPTITRSPLCRAVGSWMKTLFTAVPLSEPRSSTKRFLPISVKRAWRDET